jgi:hypothetical protein
MFPRAELVATIFDRGRFLSSWLLKRGNKKRAAKYPQPSSFKWLVEFKGKRFQRNQGNLEGHPFQQGHQY